MEPFCADIEVWELNVFVAEWDGANVNDENKFIQSKILYEMLKRDRLWNTKISLGS